MSKTQIWTINWADGNSEQQLNTGYGQCCWGSECWPSFNQPTVLPLWVQGVEYRVWRQIVYDRRCDYGACSNDSGPKPVQTSHPCEDLGGCRPIFTAIKSKIPGDPPIPSRGGNGDDQITGSDAVFAHLRLWQDSNHNGVSEASELHTLAEFQLMRLDLDFKESDRIDEHGNWFRYRAKVKDAHGAQVGRWAWDVFLLTQ